MSEPSKTARESLNEARIQTVSEELRQYGRRRGATESIITWAIQRASGAIRENGESGAKAYEIGSSVIDMAVDVAVMPGGTGLKRNTNVVPLRRRRANHY